jgi:helicase required for RNAi-mediated heterochromatin assembly 1
MLKTVPNGTGGYRQATSTSRNLLPETTYQTPANPMPVRTPDNSDSTTERWQAYTNGGAAEDDARMLQKMKEEEAQHLASLHDPVVAAGSSSKSAKLITVSPQKATVSKNADLLIDLDFGTDMYAVQPPPGFGTSSSANVASSNGNPKGKGKATVNLLD